MIQIRPEPAKALTARQESGIVRAALLRNPGSAHLRPRLAGLLNQLDEFDETIGLLTAPEAGALDFDASLLLAQACFARGTRADCEQALAATRRAVELAANDVDQSRALADQAKALLRAGEPETACDLLALALRRDPHNWTAFKRLAVHRFREGDPGAVVAMTDALAAQGVGHSRLLAARATAFAALGRFDAARALTDLPRFLYHEPLSPPVGWGSLESFNAALVEELTGHPGLRYGRYATASEKSWRIDTPAVGAAPAARALLDAIAAAVERHVAILSGAEHPWLAARPARAALRSWCIIAEGDGHEQWHMHHLGWMTGGYYARVPNAVARGADKAGCLAFGLSDGLIGEAAAQGFGETLVRPQAGSLTLFPSHAYHRTFPHGCDERRICVAFDILPE